MIPPRLRIVALLARGPGLHVLETVLLRRRELQLAAVFTHLRRPEGEGRGLPPEVVAMRELCRAAGAPLVFADGEEAADLAPLLPNAEVDLLLSIGWRDPVGAAALARFRLGGVELRPAPPAKGRTGVGAYDMMGEGGAGRPRAEAWTAAVGEAGPDSLYAELAGRVLEMALSAEGAPS